MTKDDKELIKPWLFYHGERLGYENLHVVDDSEDEEILEFYNDHANLNFNLHRDETGRRCLDNMEEFFTYIQNSIQDDKPFFLKMDPDEFLISFEDGNPTASKDDIQEAINIEVDQFWLPQANQTNLDYLKNEGSELLDCTNFTFNANNFSFYKKSFSQKQKINLGGHNISGISNKSKKLEIIHFHAKRFEDYYDLAKKVCISHNYIHESDDDQQIINKLSNFPSGGFASEHKVQFVLAVLTQQIDADTFYANFSATVDPGNSISFDFTQLKEFKDSLK